MEDFVVMITNISKSSSEQELRRELMKSLNLNDCQFNYFIPLDVDNVAQVVLYDKIQYERILCLSPDQLKDDFKNIKIHPNRNQSQSLSTEPFHFQDMPLDILYNIFQLCGIKEQLNLARTCQQFYEAVKGIWCKKYRYFIYNYLDFKYSMKLDDKMVKDLCILCGRHVKELRFSSYFNMDLLKEIEWKMGGNPMENLKYFINHNFAENVKHFENLQILRVQGKFLQDKVIRELSKFCKQLKTIELLDGDSRWLTGQHLWQLENLQNLQIKSCRNLEMDNLLLCSKHCHLEQLNIVECDLLKSVPKMLDLSANLQHLKYLNLTAFTSDSKLLKAILNLPQLERLKFYWINFMPLQFEENYFAELEANHQKRSHLTELTFENDRFYIEDESLQQWTPHSYATMRENVCINGQEWQWSDEMFQKFCKQLQKFKNLHDIQLNYCRLFNYDQLKKLPLVSSSICKITIKGCLQREDQQYLKEWFLSLDNKTHKCQLRFDSFLSYAEVMLTMFRFVLLTICLAVPALGYSTGGPQQICTNGLTPEHHVDPQTSPVPYSFSGGNTVKSGDKITITLEGGDFLGFAIQAHDSKGEPIGTFKIVESNKSQTLSCSNPDDTLTHKKIPKDNPITKVEFQWIAPAGYKGKVKFVGTVAKDGATFWVRKVLKEVDVE
uniref:Reelin domain-containing protein n=1 Tax=Glossina palpalis gambiensis TaxID=67801 RepID=A0A1B0BIX8_9MUSC